MKESRDTNGRLKVGAIVALAALSAVCGYGWLAKTVAANEERSKNNESRVQSIESKIASIDTKLDMILKEVKE